MIFSLFVVVCLKLQFLRQFDHVKYSTKLFFKISSLHFAYLFRSSRLQTEKIVSGAPQTVFSVWDYWGSAKDALSQLMGFHVLKLQLVESPRNYGEGRVRWR